MKPSKSGYIDIYALPFKIEEVPYSDNPTDVEHLENEIPKFDSKENIWTIDNLGISYPCVTMEYLPYPDDMEI